MQSLPLSQATRSQLTTHPPPNPATSTNSSKRSVALWVDADSPVTPIDPLRKTLTRALIVYWRLWAQCHSNPEEASAAREPIGELWRLSQHFGPCLPGQGARAWLRDLETGARIDSAWRSAVDALVPLQALHTRYPKDAALASILESMNDSIATLESKWRRFANPSRVEAFERRLQNMLVPARTWGRGAEATTLDGAGERLFPLLKTARDATKAALKRPAAPQWRAAAEALEELRWALTLFDPVFDQRLSPLILAAEDLKNATQLGCRAVNALERTYVCAERLSGPQSACDYLKANEMVESWVFDACHEAHARVAQNWERARAVLRPKALDTALRG